MRNPIFLAKLRFFKKEFGKKPFKLLDVGVGNHSATEMNYYLPKCEYYGIDLDKNYNNSEEDFRLMRRFWEKDVTKLQFEDIPDDYFDAILMAHIIEHLHNGDLVLKGLIPKLKKGGVIYIEYPTSESINFPSSKGLNFWDDTTHVRLYTVPELTGLLKNYGCDVKASGRRRRLINILLMPIKMIHNKIKYGYITSGAYYDIYGFCEYVFAKKH